MNRLFRTVAPGIFILTLMVLSLAVTRAVAQVESTNVVVATNATIVVPVVEVNSITNSWLTFGLDRVEFLRMPFLGNPIWQYLASLIYIILALYVSKLLDSIIHVRFRKWAARTPTRIDDLMVDLIRGPVKIISFVVLLHIGLRIFSWPEWGAAFISNGLKIVVAASLTYVATKFIDLCMQIWQQRINAQEVTMDLGLLPIVRKALKIFVVVVAVVITLQNLGMNVTGLLASLSIGGLAVGLAAQDTLSNLFGAVALFADKPFKVGDRIQLDGIDGTVEAVGLRSTRVRNLEGFLVSVPNRTMANANIVNISKRPTIRTLMNIGITYDTPWPKVELALKIINEVYRAHPKTGDLVTSFNKFESSSLNLLVVHWYKSLDFKEYLGELQKMNLDLKRRFDEEKISFAFPTQTLYVKQDSDWLLANRAANEPRN